MSFFPDITPLINEVKELNKNQQKIIALLEEQNKILKQQK
ncbi:MAG: hypothetical protein MRERV_1c122 [Mycoplasmataceae bacterium RV_VA103A]|nr:MAG: hypothetical protein MRERV_1c122 [Mycoplasmataceae bacterium RV_VA103A]